MEPQEYLSRLNEILVKKKTLLREISGFTRLQKEALSRMTMMKWRFLSQKQARMDATDKLDQQFVVYMEGLKRTLGIDSLDELPSKRIPGTGELKENTVGVLDLLRKSRLWMMRTPPF